MKMNIDHEDIEKLRGLAEDLKQKYSLKNVSFHYCDYEEEFYYIETKE